MVERQLSHFGEPGGSHILEGGVYHTGPSAAVGNSSRNCTCGVGHRTTNFELDRVLGAGRRIGRRHCGGGWWFGGDQVEGEGGAICCHCGSPSEAGRDAGSPGRIPEAGAARKHSAVEGTACGRRLQRFFLVWRLGRRGGAQNRCTGRWNIRLTLSISLPVAGNGVDDPQPWPRPPGLRWRGRHASDQADLRQYLPDFLADDSADPHGGNVLGEQFHRADPPPFQVGLLFAALTAEGRDAAFGADLDALFASSAAHGFWTAFRVHFVTALGSLRLQGTKGARQRQKAAPMRASVEVPRRPVVCETIRRQRSSRRPDDFEILKTGRGVEAMPRALGGVCGRFSGLPGISRRQGCEGLRDLET